MRDWEQWLHSLQWARVDRDTYNGLSADEQLRRIRHSSAHVMAAALREVRPEARFATGPATETGFFYDVSLDRPLAPEELERLQEAMERVVARRDAFEVAEVSHADAEAYFRDRGEQYKLDVLERIPDDVVTLYRNGDFVDLCAGPHVPGTEYCAAVRVLAASPAHWRGEQHPSLTRISGTAWENAKRLREYLRFVEEVKARDHRVLGAQLDLFSFHPWAASALWHPKGLLVRNGLTELWHEYMGRYGYVEILNPILYRKELFETSGHWEHFQEDMFIIRDDKGEPFFALKPMNCPDTMLFFRTAPRSYRELPLRVAESQMLHRNEASGALHGIMRGRNFVQDDAHIFLAPEQVRDEISTLLQMVDEFYSLFGLEYNIRLSTRPDSFMGSPEAWDSAEEALRSALQENGREYYVGEKEGAFYGPKIDISIHDSLGRQWQCGTVQLDFQLPERFGLRYAGADGAQHTPIVIHRAIFGSIERFLGVVLEHFAGALPVWLSPVQAVVLPIAERHEPYACEVLAQLRARGVRCEVMTDQSLNYRVRGAEKQKIPYILVVGDREQEDGSATVRRHKVKEQRVLPVDEVVEEIRSKIASRVLDVDVPREAPAFQTSGASGTDELPY